MYSVVVSLSISAEEYLKQYRHASAVVVTRCHQGKTVRFPANLLQRFVTHSGIKGTFRIQFAESGKFLGIEKVDTQE